MKPEERAELLAAGEAPELRSRWEKIQTRFVDEPRKSVQEADALVAQTTKQLAESFSRETHQARAGVESGGQRFRGEPANRPTPYRSFFDWLLAM